MAANPGANRIYLSVTVLAFLVVGVGMHLISKSTKDQLDRARRFGVTIEGATPTPMQDALTAKVSEKVRLRRAAELGQWEPIRQQLDAGIDPNENLAGSTLLMSAALYGHPDLIDRLLAHGSKVDVRDANGNTALLYASFAGQSDAVRTLLQHGADPHMKNLSQADAMDLAIAGNHLSICALLRQHGVTLNLRQAVQTKDRSWIDALLAKGANVNGIYPSMTPLQPAGDNDRAMQSINGLPLPLPSSRSIDFKTPLASALDSGLPQLAELLISHGAKLDQQDSGGTTALMEAAQTSNVEAARFLLQHGARTDIKSMGRYDALYFARVNPNSTKGAAIMALLRQVKR